MEVLKVVITLMQIALKLGVRTGIADSVFACDFCPEQWDYWYSRGIRVHKYIQ